MQHIKLNTKQTAKTRIIKHNKPISTAFISFRASTTCLIEVGNVRLLLIR